MKRFDPKTLPYLAALAQFVQFAHAGFILGGWVLSIVGGIIGAVVSFSVAYTGSQVASVNGQKREKWVNAGTLLMLTISPLAIIAPVYQSFGVVDNEVWRWITAGAWVLAPDAAILLDGLVTGKGMVVSEKKAPATTEKQTRDKKKVARKPITDKQLNDYWLRNPHASNTEVAEHFGVTRQAIGKRKAKLYSVAQKES